MEAVKEAEKFVVRISPTYMPMYLSFAPVVNVAVPFSATLAAMRPPLEPYVGADVKEHILAVCEPLIATLFHVNVYVVDGLQGITTILWFSFSADTVAVL